MMIEFLQHTATAIPVLLIVLLIGAHYLAWVYGGRRTPVEVRNRLRRRSRR